MAYQAELIVDAKAELGEGPIWDPRSKVLLWVNILGKQLRMYDPVSDADRVIELDQMPGTVVLRAKGGLMLALEGGFASFDPDTNAIEFITDPESDKPGNRFNDGKCDPAGRFWAGTMPYDAEAASGALYCLDTDGTSKKMISDVYCSNGIAWTADRKTMYYIDSVTRNVDAFDYDLATGDIANRRTVISVPESDGMPDGMAIDTEDKLWVAQWGGWRVAHWDPLTGQMIDMVELPVSQVSACWFGGEDLDELYITTARTRLTDEALAKEPLAGGLFKARVGVKGLPADVYAG